MFSHGLWFRREWLSEAGLSPVALLSSGRIWLCSSCPMCWSWTPGEGQQCPLGALAQVAEVLGGKQKSQAPLKACCGLSYIEALMPLLPRMWPYLKIASLQIILEFRWRHMGLRWALLQWLVSLQVREVRPWDDGDRQCRVMVTQPGNSRDGWQPPKARRKAGTLSPVGTARRNPPFLLGFWTSGLQNCGRIHCHCFKPPRLY